MARRKTSPAEDFLDLLILCPWYVSVILAASVFVFLKLYLPTIQAETILYQAMIKTLPEFAWIFALFVLIPAPISAIKAHKKKKLIKTQTNIHTIRDLEWREFEFMVAQAYRQKGYQVIENEETGPDGGVDILIEKDGNRYIVQCKQWRSSKVGVKVVREMYGVMHSMNVQGVIIVTSGMFTQEAKNFAHDKRIDLVEGNTLADLVKIAQKLESSKTKPHESIESKPPEKKPVDLSKIECPNCGAPLTKRMAKKGKSAGKEFIGCTAFPKCRFTRST